MAIQKTAAGKVDKRTKEYKEMVARAKKARAAQKKADSKKESTKKSDKKESKKSSNGKDEEVKLTLYSPEFYIINEKKKISNGESIENVPKDKLMICQFLETGEKFELYVSWHENCYLLKNSQTRGARRVSGPPAC